MTKEEIVRKAYEEIGLFSGLANENGWKNSDVIPKDKKHLFDNTNCGNSRPKSLQGIENNNGWIKIESEDDLPKADGWYWVRINGCEPTYQREFSTDMIFNKYCWIKEYTHYQPIVKPEPPIY